MRRHLRDYRRSLLRLPRELLELEPTVATVTDELTAELGRSPTTAEIAAAAGVDVERVAELLVCEALARPLSLQTPVGAGDGSVLAETIGGDDVGYDLVDDRDALRDGVQGLGPRDRTILQLRFRDGLTQSQIAARLGVSQMQVSRLLRRAFASVRSRSERASAGAGGSELARTRHAV
jgi:RNA polymerase sigma-B factor